MRENEIDQAHQLEILDKKIALTKQEVWFKGRKRKWYASDSKRKRTREVPLTLGWFTIREILHMLQTIQIDYLRETHVFYFRNTRIFARIYLDEETELTQPPIEPTKRVRSVDAIEP